MVLADSTRCLSRPVSVVSPPGNCSFLRGLGSATPAKMRCCGSGRSRALLLVPQGGAPCTYITLAVSSNEIRSSGLSGSTMSSINILMKTWCLFPLWSMGRTSKPVSRSVDERTPHPAQTSAHNSSPMKIPCKFCRSSTDLDCCLIKGSLALLELVVGPQ